MKKILGIIIDEKERFYEQFAETDHVTICRNCGTIFRKELFHDIGDNTDDK